MYNVPQTTARRRAAGTTLKHSSVAPNRRLTLAEEKSLKQWILSMDWCGMPPRIATMRQMANILVAQYTESIISKPISQNWVQNYIKCHDNLKLQYNCKYDYQ